MPAAVAALGFGPTTIVLPGGDVTVPMQVAGFWPFVNVTINGRGPYTFIIDTGAASAAVSPALAAEQPDFLFGSSTFSAGPGTPAAETQLFQVDSMELGAVRFENFQALVIDLQQPFQTLNFDVDGIIGLPVFEAIALTLDYPQQTVRLQDGVLPAVDGCRIFPLERTSANLLTVAVSVADRTTNALVDTGNNAFLLLPGSFGDLQFEGPTGAATVTTVTGTFVVVTGCLPAGAIGLGCVSYASPCVSIGGTISNLGGEAYQNLVLTIDQQSNRIRIVGEAT